MSNDPSKDQLASDVLLHLYYGVVIGTLNSVALVLRMKLPDDLSSDRINPRHKDLKELHDFLGPQQQLLFYNAIAAISELTVFRVLDFVGHYNRFESEHNSNEFPRLSLVYNRLVDDQVVEDVISQFGSNDLGRLFKRVGRNHEVKSLVDATITQLVGGSASE